MPSLDTSTHKRLSGDNLPTKSSHGTGAADGGGGYAMAAGKDPQAPNQQRHPQPTLSKGRVRKTAAGATVRKKAAPIDHARESGFGRQVKNGNQLLMQRQTQQRASQRFLQPKRQQQKQQRPQQGQQGELEVGGISMQEVLEDLQILQEQQLEAVHQLEQTKVTQRRKIDELKQLNRNLEDVQFANGSLIALVHQASEFLPLAHRQVSSRRLANSGIADKIKALEERVGRGLAAAKLVRICKQKIVMFRSTVHYRNKKVDRIMDSVTDDLKRSRHEKNSIEEENGRLRNKVNEHQQFLRLSGEQLAEARAGVATFDKEKAEATSQLRELQLQVEGQHDQLKLQAERSEEANTTFQEVMSCNDAKKTSIRLEMERKKALVESGTHELQELKGRILSCRDQMGPSVTIVVEDEILGLPVFNREVLTSTLEAQQVDIQRQRQELEALNKNLAEKQEGVERGKEKVGNNNETAEMIQTAANEQMTKEEERQKAAAEMHEAFVSTRSEVTKLEDSYKGLQDRRKASAESLTNIIADIDTAIARHQEQLESLEKNAKMTETAVKSMMRVFDENEKPDLSHRLQKAEERARKAQDRHTELLAMANPDAIEEEIMTKYQPTVDKMKRYWNDWKQKLDASCDALLTQYPQLKEIDYIFDDAMDTVEQTKFLLEDLEEECDLRKKAAKGRLQAAARKREQKKRNAKSLAGKVKKKDQQRRVLRQAQLDNVEKSEVAVLKEDAVMEVVVPTRHIKAVPDKKKQKSLHDSNFFNPMSQELQEEETPARPKLLFPTGDSAATSSFLSQNSKRVRWDDGMSDDDDDDDDYEDLDGGMSDGKPFGASTGPTGRNVTDVVVEENTESNRTGNAVKEDRKDTAFVREKQQAKSDNHVRRSGIGGAKFDGSLNRDSLATKKVSTKPELDSKEPIELAKLKSWSKSRDSAKVRGDENDGRSGSKVTRRYGKNSVTKQLPVKDNGDQERGRSLNRNLEDDGLAKKKTKRHSISASHDEKKSAKDGRERNDSKSRFETLTSQSSSVSAGNSKLSKQRSKSAGYDEKKATKDRRERKDTKIRNTLATQSSLASVGIGKPNILKDPTCEMKCSKDRGDHVGDGRGRSKDRSPKDRSKDREVDGKEQEKDRRLKSRRSTKDNDKPAKTEERGRSKSREASKDRDCRKLEASHASQKDGRSLSNKAGRADSKADRSKGRENSKDTSDEQKHKEKKPCSTRTGDSLASVVETKKKREHRTSEAQKKRKDHNGRDDASKASHGGLHKRKKPKSSASVAGDVTGHRRRKKSSTSASQVSGASKKKRKTGASQSVGLDVTTDYAGW